MILPEQKKPETKQEKADRLHKELDELRSEIKKEEETEARKKQRVIGARYYLY